MSANPLRLNPRFCRINGVLPGSGEAGEPVYLHPEGRPPPEAVIDKICTVAGTSPVLVAIPPNDWERRLGEMEDGAPSRGFDETVGAEEAGEGDMGRDELDRLAREAPIVGLVDEILRKGVAAGASDVHLEANRDSVSVRFRVDGVLQDFRRLSRGQFWGISGRVKIMANLNIMERRLPQDGRLTLDLGFERVDMRVSVLPNTWGESIVLRVLKRGFTPTTLTDIHLAGRELDLVRDLCQKPQGLFLLTGPTGSGKSTSLHAIVEYIRKPEVKIVCLEDPVERVIEGCTQVQINEDIGLGFAQALRRVLRHDPNVIMIGEIRDPDTAELAVRAAMTGHLVLSTMHTNDAVSALGRLTDLGVPPALSASVLELVAAQRLVRTLCPACSREAPGGGDESREAVGCPACRGGYAGRTAIWEFLPFERDVREAFLSGAEESRIRELNRGKGWKTLAEAGIELVRTGKTTRSELRREVWLP